MARNKLVLAIVVPLLALSGCTFLGKDGATASASSSTDPQEAARRWAACLREQGIDMPDPGAGAAPAGGAQAGGGQLAEPNKDNLRAAYEKCHQFEPAGAGTPEKLSAEELEKARAYAKCMRENGVPDFPDPDPNGQQGLSINLSAGPAGNNSHGGSATDKAAEKCVTAFGQDPKNTAVK